MVMVKERDLVYGFGEGGVFAGQYQTSVMVLWWCCFGRFIRVLDCGPVTRSCSGGLALSRLGRIWLNVISSRGYSTVTQDRKVPSH